jgi:hypothetical protein
LSLLFILNVSVVSAATVNNTSTTTQTVNSQGATAVSPQVTYTPSEINTAATKVKTFYDTNKRLPNYVTINNRQVTMPQFLLLLTYDISQTNSGSTTSIILKNVNSPTNPTETVRSGTLTKTEYLNIVNNVKTSIESTGKAPDYSSSTLGNIRFESLIYLFSKTMNYYTTNSKLPTSLSVTPYSTTSEGTGTNTNTNTSNNNTNTSQSTVNGTSFTISQITTAASTVKNFYDTNCRLPCYVTINNIQVNMAQFLQLLSYAITQTNSGSSASIILKTVNCPTNPTENVTSGSLTKTEYTSLAQTVKSSIDSTSTAPNNINSSLGTIRFETLIYIFSKIMNYYGTNKRLPNTLSVSPYINLNNVTGDVQTILDTIGREEAQYEDIQGVSDLASFLRLGYGDCWADSLYLYTRLNAASILVRIMGYVGGGTGVGYRHAWVQINVGNGWVNWNYAKYSSQHFGDVGCGTPYVLINPGVTNPSIVSTGY